MVDVNQLWDVEEAIEYMKQLADLKIWCVFRESSKFARLPASESHRRSNQGDRFIEEPTSPDDILGHAKIRAALKPYGIGVATGEHINNRVMFKQLLLSRRPRRGAA